MDKNLSVRLNQAELTELKEFCRVHKVRKSDAIRQMILMAKRQQPANANPKEASKEACIDLGGL